MLKGVDKALYESIKKQFPQSRLITVVDVYNVLYKYYCEEGTTGTKRVVAFARNDVLRLGGTTEESESVELSKLEGTSGEIPFFRQWMQSGANLYESETEYLEYTGNESQPGCIESIYFHCALLVVK